SLIRSILILGAVAGDRLDVAQTRRPSAALSGWLPGAAAGRRRPQNHAMLSALPPDDPQRQELHDEVHARPTARIRMPALVVFVAVLNEGVGRDDECAHLRRLPGQDGLRPADLAANFLRLKL